MRYDSGSRAAGRPSYSVDGRDDGPTLDTRSIFRELIARELRSGRLTPARRAKIVRYAAQLGLSAVEAGRLVTACHEEVLRSDDPTERRHALRLAESPATRWPLPLKLALTLVLAIVVNWTLRRWLG